jgi:hypothetical protein
MFLRCVSLVLLLSAALASPWALAAPPTTLDLHADTVNYYSNRFVITGDGNVTVRLSDGTMLHGETFAMDLKLNRYVLAGNVSVDNPRFRETGAAFAGFLDLDRSYFLSASGVPDRYTFFGLDWSDPHKGREQPGDAFILQNLDERPFMVGRHASIVPRTSVEMTNLRIYVYGAWLPLPSYVVSFSNNPNFAQNAFSGATADVGLPFYGDAKLLTAAHLRYDTTRGLYVSADVHYVFGRDYMVASVNPGTQLQRQWNLITYVRQSPAFESRLFFQLSTDSSGLSLPASSGSFGNLSFNTVYGRHAVGLSIDQWNNTLLAGGVNAFTDTGLREVGHPVAVQLAIQSFENEWRVFRYIGVPLKFQYRFGIGYYHDGYGIPAVNNTLSGISDAAPATWGGVVYPTIWQHFLGVTFYTPNLRVGKQLGFGIHTDAQRQWFTLPHYIDTTNTVATLSRTPLSAREPALYVSYGVINIGDYYGKDQLVAYPPYGCDFVPPSCGTAVTEFGTYTGLDAFRGIATSRNWTAGLVYSPTQYFTLSLTARRFYDTPAPVPGLGGQPPWQFFADVRMRLAKTMLLDLSRGYFFNWANNRWTPQFGIQFSP